MTSVTPARAAARRSASARAPSPAARARAARTNSSLGVYVVQVVRFHLRAAIEFGCTRTSRSSVTAATSRPTSTHAGWSRASAGSFPAHEIAGDRSGQRRVDGSGDGSPSSSRVVHFGRTGHYALSRRPTSGARTSVVWRRVLRRSWGLVPWLRRGSSSPRSTVVESHAHACVGRTRSRAHGRLSLYGREQLLRAGVRRRVVASFGDGGHDRTGERRARSGRLVRTGRFRPTDHLRRLLA